MALLFGCLWVWCGYAVACRLMRGAPVSVRWTAAFVIVAWLLCASFLLLAVLRAFTWPAGLILSALGAVAAHAWSARAGDPVQQLVADASNAVAWWNSLAAPVRILIGVGTAIAAARVCRALLMPPLAWDGLTYHLVKGAAWIQAHGFASTAAPDAAAYYDWFPPYGDVLWAWWMLGARSDAFLSLVGAAIWIAGASGTFAAARVFGASPARATLAAAALAFTPAFASFIASPYVDNLVVALSVAGLLFLGRAIATRSGADAVVAAAAFAVLAGVRVTMLPIAAIGISCAAWAAGRRAVVMMVAGVGALGAIPYLHAWIATGSPIYPLTVRVAGRPLFPGNEELAWLMGARSVAPQLVQYAVDRWPALVFFPWTADHADYLGLGLGPLLLVAAMPIAVGAAIRSGHRASTIFALAMAALTLASLAGADNLALRVFWGFILGRFMVVAVAVAVILAAASPSRIATGLLLVCAVAGVASGWPGGWTSVDVHALQAWLPWIAGSVAVAWVCSRAWPRGRILFSVAAIAITFASAARVRDRFRYEYYEAAALGKLYELHRLGPAPASSWPLWRHFDRATPLTLAVSAGWDGIGHNFYRMPLVGSRLQNRLLYIPISRDGSIFDYRVGPEAAPALSCSVWLQRLMTSNADYLVLLPPLPPESAWARAVPRMLVQEIEAGSAGAVAYRIDRAAPPQPATVSCIDSE